MKKIAIQLIAFTFTLILISCNASKKGCGLTSDANKIEQPSANENTLIS
jgi:hypothetical protein